MDRDTDKRSNSHECEINHISGYGYIMDGEPVQTHDGYVVHLKRSTSASMFGGIRVFYHKIRTLNFQHSYQCEVFGKYCLTPWSQFFSFYRFERNCALRKYGTECTLYCVHSSLWY